MNTSKNRDAADLPSGILLGFSVFFVISIFSAQFLSYKIIAVTDNYVMSAATVVMPVWYVLGDMITELYGYRLTRKLIWITVAATFTYSAMIEGCISLPSPTGWIYQPYYDYVLGHLIRIAFASFLGLVFGGFLNSTLLSKWKILIKGKYYWVRSLTSSIIGLAIYILIIMPIIFYGMVTPKQFFQIMLASFIGKVSVTTLLVFPASICVRLLKASKHLDTYDYGVNYNPFKLN